MTSVHFCIVRLATRSDVTICDITRQGRVCMRQILGETVERTDLIVPLLMGQVILGLQSLTKAKSKE